MHTPPSNDIEFDSWSSLATVTSFDAGPTQPMGNVDETGILLKDVQCLSSLSLLVESLIEQLCKLLETDGGRQKALYNIICNKLHKMKLIDQTYGIEELQFMRTHYQKALFHLLTVAKSSSTIGSSNETHNSSLLQLSTSFDLRLPTFNDHLWDFSHYRTEFEELEYIAKGGFGKVYRARNKIDRREYAIKKICLRYSNANCFEQSLKEVHVLATLNHPNIVSYKAAWLEPCAPSNAGDDGDHTDLSSFMTTRTRKRANVVIDSIDEDDDSGGIVFKDSKSSDQPLLSMCAQTFEESSTMHLHTLFKESTDQVTTLHHKRVGQCTLANGNTERNINVETSGSSLDERALCEYRGSFPAGTQRNRWKFKSTIQIQQRELATLYIKMQLCESTLRQWLDKRNLHVSKHAINIKKCLTAFRQVVQGVEYIHSKGIVHHDIKPSNIFVTSNLSEAQVGDFGLACLQHSAAGRVAFVSDEPGSSPGHKGEVGTKMYAAPEQLMGKCNPKSDIFSLGIVLFELLHPFTTDMERCKVIGQLRLGSTLQELAALPPKLVLLIKHLIAVSPADRPSARVLLTQLDQLLIESADHDLAGNKDETIKHLLNIIAERDDEIEELKMQLHAAQLMAMDVRREPS